MASSFSRKRLVTLLLPLVPLAGCSIDRFVPPAEIGSAPSEDRQLIGRVDGSKALVGRVGEPVAYVENTGPRNAGSDGIDYLGSSDTAGAGPADFTQQAPVEPMAQSEMTTLAPQMEGGYAIPTEGVSMDSGLGVGAAEAPVMAQPQQIAPEDMVIAEGATDQPVVDGIGTDNPVAYDSVPDMGTDMGERVQDMTDVDEPAYTGSVAKK